MNGLLVKNSIIMKIKYVLVAALVSSALLSGCQNLDEDPRADLTPGTYFNTPQELEGVIAAMYRVLAPDDAWGFTSGWTSYFGADDLSTHPASNKADFRDFDRLQGDSGNGSMNNQWNGPWKSIYQANAILSAIDGVSFVSDEEKGGASGQAYYMRGMCYYYLVRTFGKVPLITESIDVDDRPERNEVKEVYARITDDLTMAESLLPESWPGQPGKATRYAAKALLADVYLTMAGWPLNEEGNYSLAAGKANEVIQSGKYSLVPVYGDVFKTNNNVESIFSLQFNNAGGLPRRSTGQFCVPEEEISLAGEAGWCDYCTEVNFFRNAPSCKRTDDTFVSVIKKRVGTTDQYQLLPWDDSGTLLQHPYFKKFRYGVAEPGTTVGDGMNETETQIIKMSPSTDKTLDIIRYAMVLLNYAEASAMAGGGPTAGSYDAVNRVRKRAGLPDLTPGLSQVAFRDSVVYERAYECAGEFGTRWFDIVRLQLLPQVIAARAKGTWQTDRYWENELNANYTSGENLQTRYLAPVPRGEMERNPDWVQNPGYGGN
jgi:hypothetical protein